MKTLYALTLCLCLSAPCAAQTTYPFEQGKPSDANYRYLDQYADLKAYIDRTQYPNYRVGIAVGVDDYLNNATVKNLINRNANETVAGNAMKMASCVDGSGNMHFDKVTQFVGAATAAGVQVYGHTLAWHSQQPKGWLLSLMADKPSSATQPGQGVPYVAMYTKDFRTAQNIGWHADYDQWGYTLSYSSTDGLQVHTTKKNNSWEVQFLACTDIPCTTGTTYQMQMTVRGTAAGKLHTKLGDWSNGPGADVPFTTEWQTVTMNYKAAVANNFYMVQCGDFVGDIYIKDIKFLGPQGTPLTQQEKSDALVGAMDKWIKGMMNACGGKVKGWDLVNEAISGGDSDGDGYYDLQHSSGYKSGTWDVGGDAFYWQDYLGDIEYVRQAARLARQYGPEDMKLFINDYNLESFWDNNKKLRSLIHWIAQWEADGVTHIDGIGTQMHLSCSMNDATLASRKKYITQMFQLMAGTGKLVRVSEFDMGMDDASGNSVPTANMTEAMHQRMASYYEWIVKQYLTIVPPAQQWGICQWCSTDSPAGSGWRAGEPVGIWDAGYYRKHVYAGYVRAFGGRVAGIRATHAATTAPAAVYDITGRRVNSTDTPGVYIIGGKKVVK